MIQGRMTKTNATRSVSTMKYSVKTAKEAS